MGTEAAAQVQRRAGARLLRIDGLGPGLPAALTAEPRPAAGSIHCGRPAPGSPRCSAIVIGSEAQLAELADLLRQRPQPLAELGERIAEGVAALGRRRFRIDLGGRVLELGGRTAVMGIVNVTPDSFSDGGSYLSPEAAIEHGMRLAHEGADILDVGGESTRPGAEPVARDEELRRVLPVVEALAARSGVPVSVDTTKAAVAAAALEAGATIVNDISGLAFDPGLGAAAARAGAAVVVMHIRGEPRTMQEDPVYANLLGEVVEGLRAACGRAEAAGIDPERIIVDPGIGFGKTAEHNLELIARVGELQALGRPVLVGPSRKSFIGKVLGLPPAERLEGTVAACCLAAAAGAHLVRVHDVRAVRRALAVADAVRRGAA